MDRKYYLKGIARAKINGHESQPNDAGGVHGKTNEFGLVEIFRDLKKITMEFFKVEKILKGSLDSILSPSPSVKIQIFGG